MKKIIYIIILFISSIGLSQSNKELIRTYLEDNKSQLRFFNRILSNLKKDNKKNW